MTTNAIREKLHRFIDQVEDKRAKAIYTLFENEIDQEHIPYSESFKSELDKRIAYYESNGKMVSPEEMRSRLIARKQTH